MAKASPDRIFAVVEKITPELAAYLLSRNPNNRGFKWARIRLYAGMMSRHEWELNGQTIIISDTGELNDGQNRLQGVIESGETVEMLLIFGVSRESRTSLDQGLNRSIGDILTMVGYNGGGDLGTMTRYLIEFDLHREIDIAQALRPGRPQVMEYVGQHPDLIAEIADFKRRAANNINLSRALVAFAYHVILNETGKIANVDDFFDRLLGGHNLSTNHPILTARERLKRDRDNEKLTAAQKIEVVFRAWNAFRRSDKPKQFQIKGGPLPKLEA